ncbi:hypothetical protein GCM10011611_30950 [Aliidongia dinghuensis]|uniref:Uncharacterized protein n=1 Tax=Aliidongia dinghuensis TaxID=1867774 RepID=A0A8J2YUT2_9PROT|nr:hypothetical protein [Aliidongia dinghuensis]GGF22694.1 hypothetical protein GCM10011611_30950 [Aliidongia dinghuensis]
MDTVRDSIGEARMLEDGTIVLWLRAEGPNGQVGDGFLRYELSDPKYAEIKKHIGDIKPGESKPVPPWTK